MRTDNNKPVKQQPAVTQVDPKLQKDIHQVKNAFMHFNSQVDKYESSVKAKKDDEKENLAVAGLSVIPFYRRFSGIKEAVQNQDTIKSVGKSMIMLINAPEDTTDLFKVKKQIKAELNGEAAHLSHDYQSKFSFFRGTLLEPILAKMVNSKNEKIRKIGIKIYRSDRTVYDTAFGEKIRNLLNIQESDVQFTTRKDKVFNSFTKARTLEGKAIPKIIGRAMMRIPVISLGLIAALELPGVIKAFNSKDNLKDNVENGAKQTAKASVTVLSISTFAAVIGAIFASKKGHVGSLVGIGVGTYLGSKAAKTVNNKIDEISSTEPANKPVVQH